MNGRELADQLRIDRPEIKILFMSGYTADVIVQRGVDIAAFLPKPFSHAALAEKVREVLTDPMYGT
jgi:CheY-like chemotaxis protein